MKKKFFWNLKLEKKNFLFLAKARLWVNFRWKKANFVVFLYYFTIFGFSVKFHGGLTVFTRNFDILTSQWTKNRSGSKQMDQPFMSYGVFSTLVLGRIHLTNMKFSVLAFLRICSTNCVTLGHQFSRSQLVPFFSKNFCRLQKKSK